MRRVDEICGYPEEGDTGDRYGNGQDQQMEASNKYLHDDPSRLAIDIGVGFRLGSLLTKNVMWACESAAHTA